MATATESASPSAVSPAILEKAQKMAIQKWGIERLTSLVGAQFLRNHSKRTNQHLDAESAAVRRQLFGENSEPQKADEMGDHIILGDNTNPTPIIITGQQQSSGTLGKVLAGAALGAALIGIPGAGVAGYLLSQMADKTEPPVVAPVDDNTVGLGLSKLEDLQQ